MATEETLARRYKLRLGDGTILAVDFQGLTVWLMDKQAMVQTAASKEWRPLKEVIAEVRVAASHAAREQSKAKAKPDGETTRGGRDALPLVPPPTRPGDEPTPSDDALIGAPRGIQTLADDPAAPAPARPTDDSRPLRLKPLEGESSPGPSPAEEPISAADEHIGVAGEPIGVAPAAEAVGAAGEPTGVVDEPSAPGALPAPEDPAIPPAVDPSHGDRNPFGDAFIDEEPPAPSPAEDAGPVTSDSSGNVLSTHPQPSEDEVSRLVDALDSARVDEALIGAPPDIQTLADDPVLPVARPAGEDRVIPSPPARPDPPTPGHEPPAESPSPPEVPVAPPEPSAAPPAISVSAPSRVRVVVPDPMTRAVAPRPAAETAPSPSPVGGRVPVGEGASPSGQRPAGARPVERPAATKRLDREESARRGHEADDGPGGLSGTLLAALGAVGAFLSRFLQPISRLERGEPMIDESAPPLVGPSLERLRTTASGWAGDVRERVGQAVEGARSRRSETAESPAFTPTADAEKTPSRLVSLLQGLTTTLSAWGASVTERIRSLGGSSADEDSTSAPTHPSPPRPEGTESSISPVSLRVQPLAAAIEPEAPTPPAEKAPPQTPPPAAEAPRAAPPASVPSPTPSPPIEARAPEPAPRPQPVSGPPSAPRQVPPPPMSDVEVVPFAERFEGREPDDIYEGDAGGLTDVLRPTLAWAKLLVMIAIVAGGAVFAVVKWRTWFPTAAELGEATFTEVDRVARSRERAAEQQRAVEQLTGELPHLAPETIRLILSRSPTGVLEAREVFAIAGDATDRGFGTLTAEEATELDALGSELHERLGPLEREQLRDYGLTRARRLVFVEEHGYARALVARGAQAMPPEHRARLQGLLAKVIAAGLGPPPSR